MPLSYPNKISKVKIFNQNINNIQRMIVSFLQAFNMDCVIVFFAVSLIVFTFLGIDNQHFYGVFALLISWAFIERLAKLFIKNKRRK